MLLSGAAQVMHMVGCNLHGVIACHPSSEWMYVQLKVWLSVVSDSNCLASIAAMLP